MLKGSVFTVTPQTQSILTRRSSGDRRGGIWHFSHVTQAALCQDEVH